MFKWCPWRGRSATDKKIYGEDLIEMYDIIQTCFDVVVAQKGTGGMRDMNSNSL